MPPWPWRYKHKRITGLGNRDATKRVFTVALTTSIMLLALPGSLDKEAAEPSTTRDKPPATLTASGLGMSSCSSPWKLTQRLS